MDNGMSCNPRSCLTSLRFVYQLHYHAYLSDTSALALFTWRYLGFPRGLAILIHILALVFIIIFIAAPRGSSNLLRQ